MKELTNRKACAEFTNYAGVHWGEHPRFEHGALAAHPNICDIIYNCRTFEFLFVLECSEI